MLTPPRRSPRMTHLCSDRVTHQKRRALIRKPQVGKALSSPPKAGRWVRFREQTRVISRECRSQPPLPHHVAQIVDQRLVEVAHVEPHRVRGSLRRLCDGLRVGQIGRHRLLQQHVLAGLDRRHRLRTVKMVGTADDDGVDFVRHSRRKIGRCRRPWDGLRGLLRGFGCGVDTVDHPHPLQIAIDAQVLGRHPAASDERNVDHAFFSRVEYIAIDMPTSVATTMANAATGVTLRYRISTPQNITLAAIALSVISRSRKNSHPANTLSTIPARLMLTVITTGMYA